MELKCGVLLQSRYRLVELKGRGSFGEVWLAMDERTDMDVAVKVYIALDDRGLDDFKAEYKNSFTLSHPNLLHAYYYDVVDRQPFLVMPYCPDSAESLVGNADEKTLLRFLRDVASGLEYLHARDIIHRDIKPDNILVNQEGNFVVTDFGVSSKMKSTLRRNSTRAMSGADVAGTIGYMAPELFSRNPDAVKATDIWALGATVYEMASGELPFFGHGGALLLRGADIPEMRGEWSDGFRNIVEACLACDTWNRPTAEKLVVMADGLLNNKLVAFEKPAIKSPALNVKKEPKSVVKVSPKMEVIEKKKKKNKSILYFFLTIAIFLGFLGVLKVVRSDRPSEPEGDESIVKFPSGMNIYHGVTYLQDGRSYKIKRIELDLETKVGKCYYSDKPLFLSIEVNYEDSQTKLRIEETNPDMKHLSALGGKLTSIYEGVVNADMTIVGNGKNWKGNDFSFAFFPGDAKEKQTKQPVAENSELITSNARISRSFLEVHEGETYQLSVMGGSKSANWLSENESIVTVSANGLVKGVSPGTASVSVMYDGIILSCTVNVLGPSPQGNTILLEKFEKKQPHED